MMKGKLWLCGAAISLLGIAGIVCAIIMNDAWAVLVLALSLFALFAGGYVAVLLGTVKGEKKHSKHAVWFVAASGIIQLLISAIPIFLVFYSAVALVIGAVVLWNKKGKQKGELGIMIASVLFASAATAWSYFIFGGLFI